MSIPQNAYSPYDVMFKECIKENENSIKVKFTAHGLDQKYLDPGTPFAVTTSQVKWPWTVTPGQENKVTYEETQEVSSRWPLKGKLSVIIQIMAEGSGSGDEPIEEVSMETAEVLP